MPAPAWRALQAVAAYSGPIATTAGEETHRDYQYYGVRQTPQALSPHKRPAAA